MKLLVCDLDGTLFEIDEMGNNLGLTKRNKEALIKWKEAGNEFAVASARSAVFYDDLEKMLGFSCNYIGSNGSDILLLDKSEIKYGIPPYVLIEMLDYLENEKINASIFTFFNNEWYWSSQNNYPHHETKYYDSNKTKVLIEKESINEDTLIPKFSLLIDSSIRDEMKEFISLKYPDVLVVTSDVDKIDVGPLDITKATAINTVVKKLDTNISEVIVAGDSDNDIEMFKEFSNSYCIDHAEDRVKSYANNIVDSVATLVDLELSK